MTYSQMKSFFKPVEKDMKIIIGSWDDSTVTELVKVVVATANLGQSINMEALDNLQHLLGELESQVGQSTKERTTNFADTKRRKKL
jgi:hypothetical protein